ncbi:putative permease [Hyphomonas neptunium ATCC 15444]|uniref:Putative permease n=2 Tax=Hyphomonas TaxID=85 RepID=Q0C1U6_HYPNA|nr:MULTISPECIES: LptF/LptG family permease [Hyphomonas]ABI76431.1 putative permease [Hyphomonas neptunium ATCC 15444]KCZ92618.1 putative permease [Hyphomonas hirschiana VP5]
MTSRLSRYLSWLFLQRLLVTVFALVALLGVLDALSNADKLPAGAGFEGQMRYMWLRLPALFDRIVVFAFLLAALLTYASLIRRNELVAISAAGISVFGQMRTLIPVVFLTAVAAAFIIDTVGPPASRSLLAWLGPEALQEDAQVPEELWLSDGKFLIELKSMQAEELTGITIFERNAEGAVVAITTAETARPADGGWALSGTGQRRFDGEPPTDMTFWTSPQTPESLQLLLSPPRDLAISNLIALSEMRGSGSRPSGAYELWALNRFLLPLTAVGFLLLAVPVMQVYGRRSNADIAVAAGVAVGFFYMVVDGILKTLAENGSISPILAVALPILALFLGSMWLALEREIRK